MRFGTFNTSAEPIDRPQSDLKAAVSEAGLLPDMFVTLREGETRFYEPETR